MKFFAIIASVACCSSLALGKDSSTTTPQRETARCEAEVNLCDKVAGDDYNNCARLGQSNCGSNYIEDIDQCTVDYNDCMGKIGKAAAIHAGAIFTGAGAALSQ